MAEEKLLTDFFKNDLPAYGSYDNLRKLPGIDGLKVSQRKLVWTGLKKAKDFIKTDTFANITALDTAYIHGSANLTGVCDSLVQRFVGACNYSYFDGNSGGWGCRQVPRSSAPRYTRLKISEITKLLFNPVDNEILDKQYFEGQFIEPKCLVPVFPTIFLNPSEGLSTGFKSKIFSRNPREIIRWIKARLAGKKFNGNLLPWFRKFNGSIELNKTTGQVECLGRVEKKHSTKYLVTEIPVETSYQKYVEFLDKLVDNGTIVDYEDKCDPKTDDILFEIKTTREFTNRMTKEGERTLYETLGLVSNLREQLNCIDSENRVQEFSSVEEILEQYYSIRYGFYAKRKAHLLQTMKQELSILISKFTFISAIIKDELKISKRPKADIEKDLEKFDRIVTVDGNYNYLLRLPVSSMTREELISLKQQILDKKEEFLKVKGQSEADMWLEDLTVLEKKIFDKG